MVWTSWRARQSYTFMYAVEKKIIFKGAKLAEYEVIPVYLLFRYRSIYLYIFVSNKINCCLYFD